MNAKSYTLREENGQWLGQIVLTDDGMFSGVTDWGNLSFAWRSFGNDFRKFLLTISIDYFAGKMQTGLSYISPRTRKSEAACLRFAEHILPALQKVLKEEIENS